MNDTLSHTQSHVEDFDVFELFEEFRFYNDLCFDGTLRDVVLTWSKKLTSAAGNCRLVRRDRIEIRLSEPLLRYRSAKECRETLLHEMIHAYLLQTKGSRGGRGHGKDFVWHLKRINEITGLHVTVYHNYHAEVEYHKKHAWRCTGPCRLLPPRFGYFRRSRNLAPGPHDIWCGVVMESLSRC